MIKFKFFLIGLCFLFLNEAKAQNEVGFDTLDFNILRPFSLMLF